MQGIAKHISLSNEIQNLKLYNIRFTCEFAEFISEGLKANTSLSHFSINFCDLTNETSDIILRGLLEHSKIEYIDFSNNFLDDKTGYMISRVISRQTERRDQTLWKYGLRNEKPSGFEYTKGLISIDLSDNYLSDSSAEAIGNAIQNDNYLRSLNLCNNQICLEGCKKLIRSMRRNETILNLDIRHNVGYNENIHKRIILKISRNIKIQFTNINNSDNYIFNKENEFIKNFINYEFFNFEIPAEIVEKYNQILESEKYNNQQNLHCNFNSFGNGLFNNNQNDEISVIKNKQSNLSNINNIPMNLNNYMYNNQNNPNDSDNQNNKCSNIEKIQKEMNNREHNESDGKNNL